MLADSRNAVLERKAPLAMVRALALLVERLAGQTATVKGPTPSADERREAVREALRALAANARAGALQCRVDELGLHVNGFVMSPTELRAEPALFSFARRLVNNAVGTMAIRQGAAPGELLTLGKLLAEPPVRMRVDAAIDQQTPATPRNTPTEVLRSWSVLVTPASTPLFVPGPVSPSVERGITQLQSARTDEAARRSVKEILRLSAEAESRSDASSLEALALALTAHAREVGPGEGRLACEGGLRQLLRDSIVTLLATRIPDSVDRDSLIGILARSGEIGGRALVAQLMASEDRPSRRSYFDAIVAQDSGATQLREALNDPRWYVVRNAAALLGEMGMAEADAPLIPLLSNLDERIRIAAARALTRLGTARSLSALQQRLTDTNAEVRRLAAAAFGLASNIAGTPKPQLAPLGNALAVEPEEDVALEMIAAFGKLGGPDAVQRLIRLAVAHDGAVHSAWFRVASLEALVAARGHAAVPALEVLANDQNEEVAAAAQRLLGNILDR
ncbi:MAG: HEAT repeat domain-containing protein [Gemmatimonadaceae bacterium]